MLQSDYFFYIEKWGRIIKMYCAYIISFNKKKTNRNYHHYDYCNPPNIKILPSEKFWKHHRKNISTMRLSKVYDPSFSFSFFSSIIQPRSINRPTNRPNACLYAWWTPEKSSYNTWKITIFIKRRKKVKI